MFRLFDKINKNEVYVIAEMSANHGGNIENALEIVRRSADAGADCIKIQTYTADTITIDCDNEYFYLCEGPWDGYKLYDLYRNAQTPWEWQIRIKEECENCDVDFLSTPFDHSAVDFLESIEIEAYKIASFELIDIPLIEYTASKGKPMLISCGMGSIDEIKDAVNACYRMGNNQIILLKCCSEYPANWEDMNLVSITDMKERFHLPVGLSDHSEGSIGAIVGVSLGACVIEKHVCLPDIESADSSFSMLIEDFAKMVCNIKRAKKALGSFFYGVNNGEKNSLMFRRSLFAVKDIRSGERFTKDNIRSIRPGYGMKPKYYYKLLGKTARKDIKLGEPILPELIE